MVVSTSRVEHAGEIAVGRQYEADVYPTSRGIHQRILELFIGYEVRHRDVDTFLRVRDHGKQGDVNLIRFIVRRARDDLNERVARGRRRLPQESELTRAFGLAPGLGEQRLQRRGPRAADGDVRIAPGRIERLLLREAATTRLLRCNLIGATEVDSAREREVAVDHDDLAMVSLIHAGEAIVERVQRIEDAKRDAGLL